jgi:hypothetical protein
MYPVPSFDKPLPIARRNRAYLRDWASAEQRDALDPDLRSLSCPSPPVALGREAAEEDG